MGGAARATPRPPRPPAAPDRRLMTPQQRPRRARIAFSDSAAKQLENITTEAAIHALDRALVVISVDPDVGEPLPGCVSTPTKSSRCASCTSSPLCAPSWSSLTSRSSPFRAVRHYPVIALRRAQGTSAARRPDATRHPPCAASARPRPYTAVARTQTHCGTSMTGRGPSSGVCPAALVRRVPAGMSQARVPTARVIGFGPQDGEAEAWSARLDLSGCSSDRGRSTAVK